MCDSPGEDSLPAASTSSLLAKQDSPHVTAGSPVAGMALLDWPGALKPSTQTAWVGNHETPTLSRPCFCLLKAESSAPKCHRGLKAVKPSAEACTQIQITSPRTCVPQFPHLRSMLSPLMTATASSACHCLHWALLSLAWSWCTEDC